VMNAMKYAAKGAMQDKINMAACGALVNLAMSNKNKEAIVAAGGHLAVLDCMKKSSGNVAVLGNGCSVLINLCAGHAKHQVCRLALACRTCRCRSHLFSPSVGPNHRHVE